jgi:hypothetical protein
LTFLNPWFLLGLLGTSIPIVIHLLNLRTARRVDFSTLEFLRKIERKSLRRVRVRQLLLLILRMLIIASVAIAMARPALTGSGSGGGKGSVVAAIVLDASLSMRALTGEKRVFDLAREKALSLVESLSDGDEVFLFLPGAANENRFEGIHDLGLVRDRITAAEPGLGPANLDASVREAGRVLATTRHPNREIQVLSDFQNASWAEPDSAQALPEQIRLYLLPIGSNVDVSNAWVESIDASGQVLATGTPIEIRSVLGSSESFASREVDAELETDGRAVDRRRAQVPSGGRVSIAFHPTYEQEGVHLGKIAIPTDVGIEEDDARYFILRTDRNVPVMLVAEDPAAEKYLASAISPGEAGGSFQVRVASRAELAQLSTDQAQVAVLADVQSLDDAELEGLKRFLSAGGGVLVFTGPRVNAADWTQQFLPKLFPARFAEPRSAPQGEAFTIARLDPSHPLFEVFRGEGGGIRDARFTRAWTLVPDAGVAVLASFSNGVPALAESSLLPGRVLLFTSGLDPAWSDFPLTGAFLPFVHETIRYLAQASSKEASSFEIGEGATVWLPALPEGGSVLVRSPLGEERAVAPKAGPGGFAVELADAREPGFWVFTSSRGDTLAAFAVNVPASESDLSRISPNEIESRFAAERSQVLDAGGNLAEQVRQARVGREIGGRFLWAAALFLLLETAVAGGPLRIGGSGEKS